MTARIVPTIALALVLAVTGSARADFGVSTFEDVGLTKPNSYFNAAPNLTNPTYAASGQFASGGNSFANSYSYSAAYGGYWSGWAISNQTSSALPVYANQAATPDYNYEYMAATGTGGANASASYAVAFTNGSGLPGSGSGSVVNLAAGSSPVSMQVTNTEYDVLAMQHGDGFASPFASGNYLQLNITGYSGLDGTGTLVGQFSVMLADYTSTNPANWSIATTWQAVDLTRLAGARSLVFGTMSNDNNAFGDAIPTSFALDNLTTIAPASVPEPSSLVLALMGLGVGALASRRGRPHPPSP